MEVLTRTTGLGFKRSLNLCESCGRETMVTIFRSGPDGDGL